MLRKILKTIYLFVIGFFYTQKRFQKYKENFLIIPGVEDVDLESQYLKGNCVQIQRPIIYYYDQLFGIIKEKIESHSPCSIIRAADGEAFFLQKQVIGNIVTRHYTQSGNLQKVDVEIFKQGLLDCDLRLVPMYRSFQWRFRQIYGRNIFSEIPFECAYALMASRRIFKTNWKIGIIGSENKINIIQKLLNFSEYRDYIGREAFQDYIAVPERGTANDPVSLAESIKPKLKDGIDIYLVGIGIAKMVVLPRLAKAGKAVFFDAGAGISALAGLVNKERQYFAGWTNFRLKDYNYSQVDQMDLDLAKDKIKFL